MSRSKTEFDWAPAKWDFEIGGAYLAVTDDSDAHMTTVYSWVVEFPGAKFCGVERNLSAARDAAEAAYLKWRDMQ